MRLWTLHPQYLDSLGLVALWREALLAQKVLQGLTKGYKHHPQLARFRAAADPLAAIAAYLHGVHEEAHRRGHHFDAGKIGGARLRDTIDETRGQLLYEWDHLRRKLGQRNPQRLETFHSILAPLPHPLFRIVPGEVQDWERVAD